MADEEVVVVVSEESTVTTGGGNGTLAIADGGTGATTAAGARTNLGAAASGANTDISSVFLNNDGLKMYDTNGSHGLVVSPGSDLTATRTLTVTTGDADRTLDISAGSVTISTAGAALIDDASASAQRTTLGLGTMATQAASSVAITGGSVTGITDLTVADGGTGASDASTARTNLGLAIGTDVQAYDADLSAIAALANTDGNFIVGNGSAWVAESGATARTSLGAAASGANTDITSVYLNNTGLKVKDTNASHGLSIVPGSNITADRTLTVITGDAATTVDTSKVTHHVATIAALRALTTASFSGTSVVVESYLAATNYPDGLPHGGGTFVYDSTDVTTTDNGFSVIVDGSSRRWKRQISGAVTIASFGVVGDGATEDTTAWNRMVTAINAGTATAVWLDGGFDILLVDPSTAYTAGYWSICGPGLDAVKVRMKSTSTSSMFFQIGTSTKPEHITLSGFSLFNDDTPDGTEWQIDVHNAARVTLMDIYSEGAPFLLVGSATYNVNQLRVYRCTAVPDPSVASPNILIQRNSGSTYSDIRLAGTTVTPNTAHRAIKIAPPASGGNVDSLYFNRVVCNYDNSYIPDCILEIDYSYADVGTLTFFGCNFEQSLVPCYIHNDNVAASPSSAGFIRGARFEQCRFNPINTTSGTIGCHINNNDGSTLTGSAPRAVEIVFSECEMIAGNGTAMTVAGSATDIDSLYVGLHFCRISDRRQDLGAPLKDKISISAAGVEIIGCIWISSRTGGTNGEISLSAGSTIDNAITFSADVKRFTIEGCDFLAATNTRPIDLASVTLTDPRQQVIRNNRFSVNDVPWTLSYATAASAQTLATIPIEDDCVTYIEALVLIKEDDETNHAAFKLAGAFYRASGGGATVISSTAQIFADEDTAAFDAALSTSGNNVIVTGTLAASTASELGCEVLMVKTLREP